MRPQRCGEARLVTHTDSRQLIVLGAPCYGIAIEQAKSKISTIIAYIVQQLKTALLV